MSARGLKINNFSRKFRTGFRLLFLGAFCCAPAMADALEVTSAADPQLCTSIRNAIAELPPSTPMEKWPSLITMQGLSRPVWTREDPMQHLDLFKMIAGYDSRWTLDHPDLNPNQHMNEQGWENVKDQWIDGIRRGEIALESSEVDFEFPNPSPDRKSKTKLYRLGFPLDSSGTLADQHPPKPLISVHKEIHWKYIVSGTEQKSNLLNWPILPFRESFDVIIINGVAYFAQNQFGSPGIEILKGSFLPNYQRPLIVPACELSLIMRR